MRWRNWAGNVRFEPARVEYPTSEAELGSLLRTARRAGSPVRVVGNSHSFSRLIETTGTLVSLEKMQGLIELDPSTGDATLWGGTLLRTLGALLHDKGVGLETMGDVDAQTIAGAIGTGTHGTGGAFGIMATLVQGLTLVLANGEVVECSDEKNPEVFRAARLSLGALGVITRVRLRTVPSFRLAFIQRKTSLRDCLDGVDAHVRDHRHFEFYYFPWTDTVQCKFLDVTEEAAEESSIGTYLNDVVLENGALKIVSEVSRLVPGTTASVSKFCAWAVPKELRKTGWSHRIFTTPRLVRFYEMEYAIPRESLADCLLEIADSVRRENHRVHFPIECRFVKEDDICLSPAYGRPSAYLAVHMYEGMDHRRYFDAVEAIFRKFRGRPHWGKMHTLTSAALADLYPQWQGFHEVRRELDPEGLFATPYTRSLFEDRA